ncbi:hypothetical protein GCM10009745_45550 [Kribbella yunnanensis]|uniref:Uncharacterized protein n=1 Tax=Kribbella yunnanensis TaxID=190194 RepID=A0ABP4TVY2_9ACTN
MGDCANDNVIIQNSGYPCSGCDTIRLYWGSNYHGAFICIPRGVTYGKGGDPNLKFDRGFGLSGYGASVWNNAASAKWTGPC